MTSDGFLRDFDTGSLDDYRIELDNFQGPLDLLLHLIKKNEVDIYDIPVARITSQYVEYLDLMRELDLDVASEFLVMASTLIHLKSRMLLPFEEEEGEEEKEDPREELVRRLIEYQKYKRAAEEFSARPFLGMDVFSRPEEKISAEGEARFIEANMFQLMDAFSRVLTEAEKRKPHEVTRERFTVEDGIGHIEALLSERSSARFVDLFEMNAGRRRIVTIFLAVLELIKRGWLQPVQKDRHAPLRLIRVPDDPNGSGRENPRKQVDDG
ncbi:MAG: segregation/condensation protein A [Deltaproteobacteria bacterium]|nr:segregation/condensation protein A [Deltaproteobacteria bacterium]